MIRLGLFFFFLCWAALVQSSPECSLHGVDYSGLSSIADISITVDEPCGFPGVGTVQYIIAFCRPVNSSSLCQAAGASVCAVHQESGKIEVFSSASSSFIEAIMGNRTSEISIVGSDSSTGTSSFLNVYCPASGSPAAPPAKYSPWLPVQVSQTFVNTVNRQGSCSVVELSISLDCACSNSTGCSAPEPKFPVVRSLPGFYGLQMGCPGPNGTFFLGMSQNQTIYKLTPNNAGGFDSSPFAHNKWFYREFGCAWSPVDDALYMAMWEWNAAGSYIYRLREGNLIEDYTYYGHVISIASILFYQKSLYVLLNAPYNISLSQEIFSFPLNPQGKYEAPSGFFVPGMSGFGQIFINPITETLYSFYSPGIFSYHLTTKKLINFEGYGNLTYIAMTFSQKTGENFLLTQTIYNEQGIQGKIRGKEEAKNKRKFNENALNYPDCQIYSLNPVNGDLSLLYILPECEYGIQWNPPYQIYNPIFFMDSNDRMWVSNWGILMEIQQSDRINGKPIKGIMKINEMEMK